MQTTTPWIEPLDGAFDLDVKEIAQFPAEAVSADPKTLVTIEITFCVSCW